MKKFDFCFLITETFIAARQKARVIKELEKRGYSCLAVTTSEAGDIVMKEFSVSNFLNIFKASQNFMTRDGELEERVCEIEKTFKIENLRVEILTDHMLFQSVKGNESDLLKEMIGYILALKNFFQKNEIEIGCFVQGISGSVNSFAFYHFAKIHSKHVYHSPAPFNELICFSFDHWGIFDINPKNMPTPSLEEEKFISDYISVLKQEKKLISYVSLAQTNPHLTKGKIKTFISLFRDGNYKKQNLPIFFIVKNFWLRFLRKRYAQKFYSMPIPGEKYVFFPLHFPFDSQLTLRAVPFITQEFVIEIISRYLPFGYKLYVKEHPAAEGWYSPEMLKYINRIPNVKLVPRYINAHDLIKKAEMVCVINSTAGFEALLWQKPVITFGRSFYSDKGITLDVKNLYDLPEIINKAKDFKPDWDKVLATVNYWYKNSFPPSPQEIFSPDTDPKQKTIETFCDSLLKYLKPNETNE